MPENGLSLPGRDRLDRLEQQQDRILEMLGDLGNKVDLLAERQGTIRAELKRNEARWENHERHHGTWERDHGQHVEKHEERHRLMEARPTVKWERRAALIGVVVGSILAAAARYLPGNS